MPFSSPAYLSEMRQLVTTAIAAWRNPSAGRRPPIFTVSIWTDPDVRVSAVSIDTRQNSDAHVRRVNEYNRVHYDRYIAAGDADMAALFEAQATRNCSPADFAYREIVSCKHKSFPANWEAVSDGKCWDDLEPALRELAEWARHELRNLETESDAELAVNSRRDWYDATWPLVAASQETDL